MQNELIESRLRRDETVDQFLARAKTRYADIEADVAPHRAALKANLLRADGLKQEVLGADDDNNTPRKRGLRSQLTTLLLRQNRALRAHAKSQQPDTTLLSRLPARPGDLRRLPESSFLEEARRLLDLGATVPAADLARRRFTAAHRTEAAKLLTSLTTARLEGTDNDDLAQTGRAALERLIKADARHIAEMEEFFATYNDEDDETALKLYQEWRAARTVQRRGGSDQPRPGKDQQ